MTVKILASLIIVLASTYIGVLKSNSYKQRSKELRTLQVLIQNLETEIVYSYTPLAEAFHSIADAEKGPIASIFYDTAVILERREGISFKQAWNKALSKNIPKTCLNKDDEEILLTLGSGLGLSDDVNQKKHINLILEKLRIEEIKAEEERKKNEKLYQSLGFIGGATLVILLF